MDIQRDFARLTEKLRQSKEIAIPFPCLRTDEEAFSYGLVTKALSSIRRMHLDGSVHLIIAELLTNAERAHLKRIFCSLENRNIETQDALNDFRQKFQTDPKSLRSFARKAKPGLSLTIQIDDGGLTARISNDGTPTAYERALIESRLTSPAKKTIASLDDASLKTGEGDGTGLFLCRLIIEQARLDPGCLTWTPEEGRTTFVLRIPAAQSDEVVRAHVEATVLAEVESLPAFPENIRRMMQVCESPRSDARQVAGEIGKDPGVTGQMIKLANSGGFAGGKITELLEAVKIIGLTNVSGVLMRVGAFKILEERYGQIEELLIHPNRVAAYARTLAKKYKLATHADQAYVAGLLHDIGKAVLLSKPEVRETLNKIGGRRDRRSAGNLEELAVGAAHTTIGGMLAKKWNFPETLCHAIEFHHAPQEAPAESQKLVNLVYLANVIADLQEEKTHYYAVEPDVLQAFNITTLETFQMVAGTIAAEFSGGS